jgi:hypothetical protein
VHAHGAHLSSSARTAPHSNPSALRATHTRPLSPRSQVGLVVSLSRAQIAPLANAHRNAQRFRLDGFLWDPYPCQASSRARPPARGRNKWPAPPENRTGSLRRALRRVRQAHSGPYCIVPISYHRTWLVTCPPSEPTFRPACGGGRGGCGGVAPFAHDPNRYDRCTTSTLASARAPYAQLAPPLNVGLSTNRCAGSCGRRARRSECHRHVDRRSRERGVVAGCRYPVQDRRPMCV